MDHQKIEEIETDIEYVVGSLYGSLFRLRQAGARDRERSVISTLIDMLQADLRALSRDN